MQIGIILLSKDGYYLRDNNTLPVRPSWDKKFLLDLVEGLECTCSEKTFETLPNSVKEVCDVYVDDYNMDVNLGIQTFEFMPTLIFVVRSIYDAGGGKLFRLNTHKKIIEFQKEDGGLEIWKINTSN